MRRIHQTLALTLFAAASLAGQRTKNVVLVVTDGLRWQDVFTGADSSILFGDARFLGDTAAIRRDFWRATPDARRTAMMPFLWGPIAKEGQIFGNATKGSVAQITNGLKFSYPGYNEMLTGAPDPRIRSNSFGPNPNVTVFETLAQRDGFANSVAAFGTWGVFRDIFNRTRATNVFVHAGFDPPIASPRTRSDSVLDRLYRTTFRQWDDNAYDAFMQTSLLDYLREHSPRVLFVGYGETDEWAHSGRYDRVLRSARAVDDYIAELWRTLQSMPVYRGTTSMIITTDHGRGSAGTKWRDHGEDVDGAENIWIAVIGPDTPARGERTNAPRVTQSQIAGTLAALLGQEYAAGAPPIAEVVKKP
jgi:hypothetical protein